MGQKWKHPRLILAVGLTCLLGVPASAASDNGTPLVKKSWDWRPGGGPRIEISGEAHSQYWDQGSDGLENMGKIIVGQQPSK